VTVQPTRGGGSGRRRRRRGRGRPPGDRNRSALAPAAPLPPLDESADPIDRAARRLGIARLHPEQRAVIETSLDARDVLMVLPTGFGKSACYQVPSMLLDEPVLLISPLLALLKDQHEKLIKHEIPCVRLDGTVRGKAREREIARLREGGSLLVMTTPESLGSEEIADALNESGVSMAAIDEAHCISEWGYDFRPAYQRLGERLRALGAPPLMALTATATENVRRDIVRFLGMRNPVVVSSSPHRSNLAFEVLEAKETARLRALARLAQRLRRPGIIYCTTTKAVDEVYTVLAKLGIPTHRYHGKMAAGERNLQQEMFMKPGRRTVMVATSAFGLGIDKPDIRYVVHQSSPASLEQYVQEAGRAGRDGGRANCILMHDETDRSTHEALLSRSRLKPEQLFKLGSALAAWAGEGRTPTIDALALSADLGDRTTSALLVPIEEAGIVCFKDLEVEVLIPADQVEEAVRSLAGQFATLRTQDGRRLDSVADYAHVQECRAEYLRRYFGEEHGEPCGLCDVCRGRPERPSTFFQPVAAPPRKGKKRHRALLRGLAGVHKKPPPSKQQEGSGDGNRRRRRRRRKRKGGGPEGARPAEAGAPTTSPTPASPPAGS
jgi:ATP-dependent DNA helicase RecQ